jgi:hypothetical protein
MEIFLSSRHNHFSFLPPFSLQAARCGISQFLQSLSPAAQSPDASPPSLALPAAAAAAFVSEISASHFVSGGGSSGGGGSVFAAIADVDVKVAALNEYVYSLLLFEF